MGRRKQTRGTSADDTEQDVQDEPAKEVTTRSGKHYASSDGSPVKEQTTSPVLRSSFKRDSSKFDKPPPKRLSAYAQRNLSRESDSGDVLIMGKNQSRKTKEGSQKDVVGMEELGCAEAGPAKIMQSSRGRRRSSNRQAGGGANVQGQGPHGSKKATTARQASKAGSVEGSDVITGEKIVASKTAQKVLVEVIEEKTSPHCSDQGSSETSPETQQSASVVSRGSEDLPDILATMDVGELVPAGMISTGQDQGMTTSTSSLCIFPLGNPDEWVVVLSHPQEIFLRGKAYVRSLQGHVAIQGYLIRPSGVPRPVYSPDCSSLLAVGTVQLQAPSGDYRETIRASLSNEEPVAVERILGVVNVNSVVLVFSRLDCRMCRYVAGIKPFTQLFSGSSDQSTVTKVGALDLAILGRDVQELHMRYDEDYTGVVRQYCDQVTKGGAPVVVVCGGKNVGKSTLTRYIINSVLNCCDKVAYLECDVGQTEFTPSGCPALCVVTQPLLGPPFTHHRKPRRWSYFGGLSPGAQPMDYLRCLRYAYESYVRMDSKLPLVVNTMGWNKGLGVALMVETVRMVRPEFIIQINSARQAKNFPTLTREFLDSHPGIRWSNSPVKRDANKTIHELVILKSPVSASLDGHEKYRPKDLRNLMLLTYFGQLQPEQGPTKNLAELQPHTVPWSAVGVHICSGVVDNSQVMYALNASVVALCIADEKMMHRSKDPTYPKFFYENPVCQGVGFGIVRAIDPEKKVFHILTPVPWGELKKVNCLLKGDLELPEQLLLQQRLEGECPYVGSPSDVIGASSTKKRRHMFRQRRGSQR